MNPLIDHTPAENAMLLDKGTTPLKLLLRVTLMDLVLKEVLLFQEIYRRPHPQDDVKRYVYVQRGPSYSDHVPRRHEEAFLKHFEYSDHRFLFRNLVRLAFEDARDEKSFRTRIMHQPETAEWWKTQFQAFIGRPLLTSKGEAVRNALLKQLKDLEEKLVPWLEAGDSRAHGYMRMFGGNILLIPAIPLGLLPPFKNNAFVPAQQQYDASVPMSQPAATYGVLSILTAAEFDFGFDSAEGSGTGGDVGTTGCGGDGGCSGCSGCGGCGGCGG